MPLGLIQLRRMDFLGIFVTVCFLIILLLSKQTVQTNKKLHSLNPLHKIKGKDEIFQKWLE